MLAKPLPTGSPVEIEDAFRRVRLQTEDICGRLEIEDHVVQPAPFVSPPKWHLAHTTWFFDNFILDGLRRRQARHADGHIDLLFNSYYKSQGEHWLQAHRGHLSRPTVREILDYRAAVTAELGRALQAGELEADQLELVELGIHHEQQHQELLFMDIKYILGTQPAAPAYDDPPRDQETADPASASEWVSFPAGLREVGLAGEGFGFDNERPRHRAWQEAFSLRRQLVRNSEFQAFIEDGGYRRPELWLSDGWDWLHENDIQAPLYWRRESVSAPWQEYHLDGLHPLDPSLPVSHVSYYEADAFATWAGARLASEQEMEIATADCDGQREGAFWRQGKGLVPDAGRRVDALENGLLWQWTRSDYSAYPGYAPQAGALGEYNGKFMSGQYVLRGGCVATPQGHWRPSYRNFYRPGDRWSFTGIRLAKDAA